MIKRIARHFPILLLGWAARYFPILRVLKHRNPSGELLLEIGSGSIGLAAFQQQSFVGCDVAFSSAPRHPMIPVRCSATRLPFADGSFSGVVASDVLEHLPLEQRDSMVNEILRVAGKFAVFGFPCGSPAYKSDWHFQEYLKGRGIPLHGWLEEHMRYQYPDLGLFSRLTSEWSVESSGNENVRFHNWVNRCEMSRIMKGMFWILLTLMPRAVEAILGLAERAPFYRMIVVVTRKSMQEARLLVDSPTQFERPHV